MARTSNRYITKFVSVATPRISVVPDTSSLLAGELILTRGNRLSTVTRTEDVLDFPD